MTLKVDDIQELIIDHGEKFILMSRILEMMTCQGKQDKASQEGHSIWMMKMNCNSGRKEEKGESKGKDVIEREN